MWRNIGFGAKNHQEHNPEQFLRAQLLNKLLEEALFDSTKVK